MFKSNRLRTVGISAWSRRTLVAIAAMATLVVGIAACGGGSEPPAPAAPASSEQSTPAQAAPAAATQEPITLQVVCINRALRPCELIDSFYAPRVAERTNGEVTIEISSYPELGLAGPDTIRLVNDDTLEFAEIYSGYVGGDLPIIDVGNLWGLSPSNDAHLALTDAIEDDMIRILRDATGGEPIFRAYYPNQYVFSREPLPDLSPTRTRTSASTAPSWATCWPAWALRASSWHSPTCTPPWSAAFWTPESPAAPRATANAGTKSPTISTAPSSAPLVSLTSPSTGEKWAELSPENQQILKEVGAEFDAENRRLLKAEWDPDGINLNVEEGMEYHDFPDDVKARMRVTALETIIPNWVERAGGPSSEGVQIFNEKSAPSSAWSSTQTAPPPKPKP